MTRVKNGRRVENEVQRPRTHVMEIPFNRHCRYLEIDEVKYFNLLDLDRVLDVKRNQAERREYVKQMCGFYAEDIIEIADGSGVEWYGSEKWLKYKIAKQVSAARLQFGSGWSLQLRTLAEFIGMKEVEVKKERAMDKEPNVKSIEYKGRKYESYKEIAEEHGMPSGKLYSRLSRGQDLDEAMKFEGYKRTAVEYNGKQYANMKILAEEVGITYSTLYSRVRRGVSVEEAIERGMLPK